MALATALCAGSSMGNTPLPIPNNPENVYLGFFIPRVSFQDDFQGAETGEGAGFRLGCFPENAYPYPLASPGGFHFLVQSLCNNKDPVCGRGWPLYEIDGQIIAFNNRTFDVAKAVPTVVMRNEDYGRISRILADGTPVELEFNIVNTVYPEGRTAYNTIAEIPGTDKKNEIVMLGGHLDSWHSATGATDNAIGCATMMEAARILKAIGVTPRRTIRVALWSGEEEGILGSQAYVKDHFGTFESQKQPEYSNLAAYLNIDSGTGRARGAGVFGPPAAAAVVREALAPFQDLGVMGASATTSRAIAGTATRWRSSESSFLCSSSASARSFA